MLSVLVQRPALACRRNPILFPVVLFTLFYFSLSFACLVHVYTYNELADDDGCAIGALFCHGETGSSTHSQVNHFFRFQFPVYIAISLNLLFIPFDFSLQRGPPQS